MAKKKQAVKAKAKTRVKAKTKVKAKAKAKVKSVVAPVRQWNWLDSRGERAVEGAGEKPLIYNVLGSSPQNIHPFNIYRDIMSSPKALADTLRLVPRQTDKVAAEIKKRGLTRVVAAGLGTSTFAAQAAAEAFGRFADFDATAIDCGEFLTSRRNFHLSSAAFIVFSGSGRTFDALAAAKKAREGGAYVVAVTSAEGSQLAHIADDAIVCKGGLCAGGADTFHYMTRVAAAVLTALALGEKLKGKGVDFKGLRKQLASLPVWLTRNLPALDGRCRSVARQYKDARAFITVGGGPNLAIAEEFALKLDEMAHIPAKAMCPDRHLHGAIGLTDCRIVTAIIAPPGPSEHWLRLVAEATVGLKAPAIGIVNESEQTIASMMDYVVRLPDLEENIFAVAASLPAQLISYWLAVEQGNINPDAQRSDNPRHARVWMKLFPNGSH